GITWGIEPQAAQGLTLNALYADDNHAVIRDGLGDATVYQVDPEGREVFEQAPRGGTQELHRNAAGQVTEYIDENGLQTFYQYSAVGDLTEQDSPDGSFMLYQYADHDLTEQTSLPAGGRENVTRYGYDPSTHDLQTVITDPGTGAAATTTYEWNAIGEMT